MSSRLDRLAAAEVEGSKKSQATTDADRLNTLGKELHHAQKHLEPHGLTVMSLLGDVAKHFHGVTIPPIPSETDEVEG